MNYAPPVPKGAFRITLHCNQRQSRLDTVLLQALREQEENLTLKNISRSAFKDLFYQQKVQIKGQSAKPSSAIATGTTYVDILE